MKKLLCLLAILMPMLSTNCFAQEGFDSARKHKWNEQRIEELDNLQNSHCQEFKILRAPEFQFKNLKGLNINIEPTEADYSQEAEYSGGFISLSNSACFIMPTVNYIKSMGFNDTGDEYTLNIYLKKIIPYMKAGDYGYLSKANVTFQIEMTNIYGEVIFEQVVSSSKADYLDYLSTCLNIAYTDALAKINWYKIASFLKEGSAPKQQVKQESKEVNGYGNTALENTIVRWDVQSRPAGADVFWRVVSKTPSVKSTNNKYLQTTPYEATKSLDIRGLSYENSGDVRIILRCEKEGYYPQEKEFNVRMIIDQEEISAFFRLVKEE